MKVAWAVVAVASLWALGCDSEETCGPSSAVVDRVIDGDSIVLADGTEVRYLGVDTPEDKECYGDDATKRNKEILAAHRFSERPVRLEYDATCADDRGRMLAYVFADTAEGEVFVNQRLLEEGLANLCRHVGLRHEILFGNAEHEAESMGRGMWGACDEPGSLGACD